MYTSSTLVFGAILACARIVAATPPACLLGALQVQTNPSDIKSLCGTLAESMRGNITQMCGGDAETEAKKAYADTCLSSAAVTITFSSSSSSSSGSSTKGSSTATKSGSASATTTGSDSVTATGSPSVSTTAGSGNGPSPTAARNGAATTTGGSNPTSTPNAASGLNSPNFVKLVAPIVFAVAIAAPYLS